MSDKLSPQEKIRVHAELARILGSIQEDLHDIKRGQKPRLEAGAVREARRIVADAPLEPSAHAAALQKQWLDLLDEWLRLAGEEGN